MFISPPEREFRQNLTWRILVLFPALVAWLVALRFYSDANKIEPVSAGIAAALTALAVWVWIAASKSRLSIHSEGVQSQGALGAKEMRWEEIRGTRFQQTPVAQQAAIHFGLLGYAIARLASRGGGAGSMTLTLEGADGGKLRISPTWKEGQEAIRIVLRKVDPRIKEEIRRLVRNGETVKFGKVSLSSQGVAWKDNPPIPFATLTKSRIDGQYLRMKAEGKWLDNVSCSTGQVPNVFVLLDLVDEFKSGGKTVEIDPIARAAGAGAS